MSRIQRERERHLVEALREFALVRAEWPETLELPLFEADAWFDLGSEHDEHAKNLLEESFALSRYPDGFVMLAGMIGRGEREYPDAGAIEKWRDESRKWRDRIRDDALRWQIKAVNLARLGRRAAAIDATREAVRRDPDNPDRQFALAFNLFNQHPDATIETIERCLELGPDHPQASCWIVVLAACLARTAKTEAERQEARQNVAKIRSSSPDKRWGEAEEFLRDHLTRFASTQAILELWCAISFADLGRSPADLLAILRERRQSGERDPLEVPFADLRRLLETLSSGRSVRINCGGERYEAPDGSAWSRDRFATGGYEYDARKRKEDPTADSELERMYRTYRWFSDRGGYRVPLPEGRYEVTLRFAEVKRSRTGESTCFDVLLESRTELENYEPGANGFATAREERVPVNVDDGVLDIQFGCRIRSAKISAIEITPFP